MIDTVKIHNFRGLRNIDVHLARLTVLIGPNNSGKTSFLQAIDLSTQRHASGSLPIGPASHWRSDIANPISIKVNERVLDLIIDSRGQARLGTYNPVAKALSFEPVALFRLPFDIKMSSKGFEDVAHANRLELGSSGENVAAMIDYMLRRARDRFDLMVVEARKLIPGLQSLSVSTPKADVRRLDLVMEGGWEMPADNASAGVRMLLFFLALTHRPDPPRTILIEEPENGIHPLRLESIMQMLIRLADSEDGPQVILTTHSPYLLDCLDLEKHSVLVFARDEEGGCTAKEIDAVRLKPFLNEFMLGEVWMNQGERELVNGGPLE